MEALVPLFALGSLYVVNKNTKKKLFILTHDLLMSNFCMIDNVPVILNTNGVYYIFDSV